MRRFLSVSVIMLLSAYLCAVRFDLNPFSCIESEIDVGSQLMVATATGKLALRHHESIETALTKFLGFESLQATAVYCEAMPPPRVLEISRTIAVQDEEDEQLVRLQRLIETFSARNRIFLNDAGKYSSSDSTISTLLLDSNKLYTD